MRRLIVLCFGVFVLGLLCRSEPAWAQKKKLEDLLKDLDSKTAATKIAALEEFGKLASVKITYAEKALPQIRDILAKDGDVKVRIAALTCLSRIEGEEKDYVPSMIKYLKEDKDFGVQGTALQLIAQGQQGSASAVTPLKERYKELLEANKDQDPGGIRSGILNTIATVNQGLSVPTSMEALKDDKAISVKLTAVGRLAQIGGQGGAKEAAPVLIEAYEESLKAGPSTELRRGILGALAGIEPEPKRYLPLLIDTLKKDKDAATIVAVIAALGRGGEAAKDAIPLVLEAQKNATAAAPKDGTDPNGQRRIILESVVKLVTEPKELVPVLVNTLKTDREPGVRSAALAGLAGLGAKGKDAIPTLVLLQKANNTNGAKDPNDPNDLRKQTLETMAKMEVDPKEFVPLLTECAKGDKNPTVRITAVKILGDLGPAAKSATTVLTAIQKLAKTATEQDKALAKAAGEALEKIKGK